MRASTTWTIFSAVLAADGSTLDALLHKVGLLREREDMALAGRVLGLLDLGSRLPRALWYGLERATLSSGAK